MKKTGNEHFTTNGEPKGFVLKDFWSWNASDLLNNALRGNLAEFIVAKALGISTDKSKSLWDEYDLLFQEKWKIEVKSSAYIQSWSNHADRPIRFAIRQTRAWTKETGRSLDAQRQADLYVFCLLKEKDKSKVNPLAMEQWEFFPINSSTLDKQFKNQKTASLSAIMKTCPKSCDFDALHDRVVELLEK